MRDQYLILLMIFLVIFHMVVIVCLLVTHPHPIICDPMCWGFFSPGLGSDEPERRTLGQSLVRTDKFIFVVKSFYRSRNKEFRVYSQ